MNQEEILREFSTLPTQAQQMVAEFIIFLKNRYPQTTASPETSADLLSDEFVGMWRDREDMVDSASWVRRLREQDWN